MDGSERFSALVESFYEAAFEPQLWPIAMERLAEAFGADSTAISLLDQVKGDGWMVSARADPAAVPLYFAHFAARNPIRPQRNRVLGLGQDPLRWRTMAMNDEQALPKNELMRSEYYGDFLRPFGIHSVLMMGLALEGTRFASLSIMRCMRRSQFMDLEIALAATVQADLVRAFALGQRLSGLQQRYACLAEFLECCAQAVFLTDGAAQIRYSNRAAEALSIANVGLTIRGGRIAAVEHGENRKLHAAIAAASGRNSGRRVGATLALSRRGRRDLLVIVAPMRSERLPAYASEPLVAVWVSDPDARVVLPADWLRQLYGLTPAEAKIATELLSGADAKEIAERQSLSVHTVRVHIARILAKTETSRQADLVRLLARVCNMPFDRAANAARY